MTFKLTTGGLVGGLAALAVLAGTGIALADPATATASINVRSGPGTSYPIVDSLYAGEGVDVQNCQGSWCYIEHDGPNGWVSAGYLAGNDFEQAPPPVYVPPPTFYPPRYPHLRMHIPMGTPNFPPPDGPWQGHPPRFHVPGQPGGNTPPPTGTPPTGNPPTGTPPTGMGNPGQGHTHTGHNDFCQLNPDKCLPGQHNHTP